MASLSRSNKTGRWRVLFKTANGNGKRVSIHIGAMQKKPALAITRYVEQLISDAAANHPHDQETATWLGKIDESLHKKLQKAGLCKPRNAKPGQKTLGEFLVEYISARTDLKPLTAERLHDSRRKLEEFFGTGKLLSAVSPGDTDDYRRHLEKTLSDNTVRRQCGRAKQFFRAAYRKRLIAENPFDGMRDCNVQPNRSRDYFLTRADAAKIIEACPDAQWRLLFALSRFAGLRCPSEHLALRWGDIDWERGRMHVRSPKTEHHQGRDFRLVPIFPELRPYLEAVFDAAEPGTEFVITRYRDRNSNLRTQLNRIIAKAGLKPWPKLFANLRATCETELAERFPQHVVCSWIGHTPKVAAQNYLQVTEEHFARAAQETTQKATRAAAQNPRVSAAPVAPLSEQGAVFPSVATGCNPLLLSKHPEQDSNLRPVD